MRAHGFLKVFSYPCMRGVKQASDAPPRRAHFAHTLASTRTLPCNTPAPTLPAPRPRLPAPPRPLNSSRHTSLHHLRVAPPTARHTQAMPLGPRANAAQSLAAHNAPTPTAHLSRPPQHLPRGTPNPPPQLRVRSQPRPRDSIFALARPLRSLSQFHGTVPATSPQHLRISDRDPVQSSAFRDAHPMRPPKHYFRQRAHPNYAELAPPKNPVCPLPRPAPPRGRPRPTQKCQ